MATATSQIVFGNETSTTECSDVHIRMIHLRQANKREVDLLAFRQLQNENLFTDMTLVVKDGRKLEVHSLVVAANSKYLKPWMETTFVPDLNYTILLPDVDYGTAQALCQILYGLDLSMSQTEFSKIHQLAEFLGITMDIKHGDSIPADENWEPHPPENSQQILQNCPQVLQSSQQVLQSPMPQVPEIAASPKVTERLLPRRPKMLLPKTTKVQIPKVPANTPTKVLEKVLTSHLTQDLTSNFTTNVLPKVMAKFNRKVPTRIAPKDRTKIPHLVSEISLKVTEIPGSLPICCWHCNLSFPMLEDLKQHLNTHAGQMPKDGKRHKCQKCKKILPSMWKLRQHLLTHKAALANRQNDRRDHQYAGPLPTIAPTSSDHLYASSSTVDSTPPAVQFQPSGSVQSTLSDHAYNSRPQQTPHSEIIAELVNPDRYDHIYFSRKQARVLLPQVPKEPPPQMNTDPPILELDRTSAGVAMPSDHAYSSLSTDHVTSEPQKTNRKSGKRNSTKILSNKPPTSKVNKNTLKSKSRKASSTKACKLPISKACEAPISKLFEAPAPTSKSSESPTCIVSDAPTSKVSEASTSKLLTSKPLADENVSSIERSTAKNVAFQAHGHSYAAQLNSQDVAESGASPSKKFKTGSTRSFPCDQCDRTFPQLYRRTRHVREVHEKERKHICRFCDKSFFKVTSMQRHELIHAVHQKWQCPRERCSKTFTDQSALKYHIDHKVCSKEKKLESLNTLSFHPAL